MSALVAANECQAAMVAAGIRAQQQVQSLLAAETGVYLAYLPEHRAHRCAYCRTLDSASVRCPSCGAPR